MNTLTIQPDPKIQPDCSRPLDFSTQPDVIADSGSLPECTVGTIDISADRRPGLGRLASVEFRKMVDTRSGRTLFAATAVIAAVVNTTMLILVRVGKLDPVSWVGYALAGCIVGLAFLLPAIVILSVTGEWNHRAALSTFTLVPARGRVLLAKFFAVIGATLIAAAVALGIAALTTAASGVITDVPPMWDGDIRTVGQLALPLVYISVMAFAFAVLALNSAAALVGYYLANLAIPTMINSISQFSRFGSTLDWINPVAYRSVALEPSVGANWAHLAVSSLIWIGVPMVIGIRRVLTSEIK